MNDVRAGTVRNLDLDDRRGLVKRSKDQFGRSEGVQTSCVTTNLLNMSSRIKYIAFIKIRNRRNQLFVKRIKITRIYRITQIKLLRYT